MKKFLFLLVFIGILDAGYLSLAHFSSIAPPCSVHLSLVDCGAVLRSSYSLVFGIPLAVLGFVHYLFLYCWLFFGILGKKRWASYFALLQSAGGALFSVYLVYLQLAVIHALCLYCMLSAGVSLLLFILVWQFFREERKRLVIWTVRQLYTRIMKPLLFLCNPERVHVSIVGLGEMTAQIPGLRQLERWLFHITPSELSQKIGGVTFALPIGLAAGFDYEARLTQTLAPLGFGFQTVGTITDMPWEGNAQPRLGRLPLSKSLMVNKGFRNPGANEIIQKLQGKTFEIPVGISIGDPKGNISGMVSAFKKFEKAKMKNAYYELNISCPNLHGALSFYEPENLTKVLKAVDALKLKRPVWVKMPINLSDKQTLSLLKVIDKHSPSGVIFGNLQHDRTDPAFDPAEVQKFPVGNFSGKPTFSRSNELIALTRKHYKSRFVIVGCGGVFTAEDAFTKIQLGANLVQMITGMIFQGPQAVVEINLGLLDLLEKEGYSKLSDAVGVRVK